MTWHFLWKLFAILIAAIIATALPGCGGAEAEEHDHLEHHVPAHKPADYPDAVEEIVKRLAALRTPGGVNNEAVSLQLLVDIIRWLPELAGDSDMSEEPWNRVNAASKKLLTLVEPALRGVTPGQPASLPTAEEIAPLLAELRLAIQPVSADAGSEGSEPHG